MLLLAGCLALSAGEPQTDGDSLATRSPASDSIAMMYDSIALRLDQIAQRLNVQEGASVTTDEPNPKDHWKKVVLRKGWSINDTSIVYPRVLDFGVRAYRWLNHALNYYDSAYVVNPGKTSGKKWKVMIKNNNWIDFYSGHLSQWRTYVQMNSDVTSLFGFQICDITDAAVSRLSGFERW